MLYNNSFVCVHNMYCTYLYFTAALENGTVKYQSRHNKTNLTTVVTNLLVQLDCAVTTAHQCFTKDVFDRNEYVLHVNVHDCTLCKLIISLLNVPLYASSQLH